MCFSPTYIPNPNYGNKVLKMVDTTSRYIPVPCGFCKQCIALKSIYMVQRIQVESLHNHLFYGTLTYNNEMLPRYDVNGYSIPYADIKDFQLMCKRLNDNLSFGVPFRYFAVSERGSEKGRPHMHCILIVPKFYARQDYQLRNLEWRIKCELLKNWQRNLGSSRSPYFVDLCTYKERVIHGRLFRNFDLHYIEPKLSANGCADAAFYILKYMLKLSDKESRLQQALHLNLDPDDYEKAWSILRSRSWHSLGFGLNSSMYGRKLLYDPEALSYVRKCVDMSDRSLGYPCFFNPDTGVSSPLARWYRSIGEIYSYDDALKFFDASGKVDGFVESQDSSLCIRQIDSFLKSKAVADLHSYDDIFTNF